MKINITKSKSWLVNQLFVLAFIGLLAALALPQVARAQYQPNFFKTLLTNGPVVLPAAGITNLNLCTSPITVRQGTGLSIFTTVNATNASTAATPFYYDTTPDGTNWTTTKPLTNTVTLNGTTTVIHWVHWPPATLSNVRQVRVTQATNAHTSSITISNIVASYSNQ